MSTGKFKKFNYGSDQANIETYGTSDVPELDLDKISDDLPIALFNGL